MVEDEDVPETRLRIGPWVPEYVASDPAEEEPGENPPEPVELFTYLPPPPMNRRRMGVAALAAVGTVLLLVLIAVSSPSDHRSGSPSAQPAPPTWTDEGEAVANPSARAGFGTVGVPSSTPTRVATPTATTGPTGKPSPDASPADGTVPLAVGARVSLESADVPGYRVRHRDFVGRIDPIGPASSALARADATFTVRAGLANARCVTFEAVNYPGYFLRHQNFAIFLHRNDGSRLFAADATFCPRAGLAGRFTSFQSYNYPGRYLRHRADNLYLDPFEGDGRTRGEMTYAVLVGLFR
jgi:hypothetical protein